MKCKDCEYNACSLDGCMYSTNQEKEACKYFTPMKETEDGDKRD